MPIKKTTPAPSAADSKKSADTKTNSVKNDFITIASHQLRTPISGIRWSLDTVLSGRLGELNEKQRETIQEAYQNNQFLLRALNDLLRVANVDQKGLALNPSSVDITKEIAKLVTKLEPFCEAANCKFKLLVGADIPKAYIDPVQVMPVIESLIDNAMRYSKVQGRIGISVKKTKDMITVTVTDNGIGIPADQQDLIFSKFFRGRNALTAQTEGIGLDLYLARKIVLASGGDIVMASEEGKGTTVTLTLPTNKQQFAMAAPTTTDEASSVDDMLKKEREFVSITVHELKAPLGITKWSLEMLKGEKPGPLTTDQIELIDQIYRGNERLLTLVRDLLNLSKLQEGKFEIEVKPAAFEQIVSDVVDGFRIESKQKQQILDWKKPSPALPKVSADSARAAQVVTNLVSNAVKYTPDKGKLTVKLTKLSGLQLKAVQKKIPLANIMYTNNPKGYIVVSVKDTGIGISAADQKKLFGRFFRSENVLKSKTEGTGLGLYITKSIVNLHKGDIWFESTLGKGSTFYFSLPIA